MRVTAQLLDPASGAHLWGDRWDRPSADVFAIQSEVAEAVAGQLGGYNGTIVTVDQDLAKRKRPEDLGAYDRYLVGWPISTWARSRASRRPSAPSSAASPSTRRSPAPGPASRGAICSCATRSRTGATPLRRAIEAARRAVALDARDGEAAAALAFALGEQGDLAESEAMFDRALALNPSSAEILTAYASWASTFGKPEAGVEAAQRALRLNPNMPPAALAKNRYAFFMTGRYDEALRLNARIPREAYGRDDFIYRAVLLNETGNAGDARAAVAEALERFPTISVEGWSGQAGYSDAERQRWVATMRKAGFPLCAGDAGAGRAVGGAAADRVRVAAGHMNVRRLPIRPRRQTLPSLDTRRPRMHVEQVFRD